MVEKINGKDLRDGDAIEDIYRCWKCNKRLQGFIEKNISKNIVICERCGTKNKFS